MISLTSAQLNGWLIAFIWPFTRVLGLIATAPVTSGPQFPTRAKIALAFLISIVIAPTLPALPAIDPGSWAGLASLARELTIGLVLGFMMRLVFVAVEMASELIGLQMGLGFAQFFDVFLPHAEQLAVLGSEALGPQHGTEGGHDRRDADDQLQRFGQEEAYRYADSDSRGRRPRDTEAPA